MTAQQSPTAPGAAKVAQDLTAAFGTERLSVGAAVREQHGRDESHHPAVPPEVVFYAESTEDVAAAVRLCAEHDVPIIAFGTGTSLEGHVAALHGGLCIDVSRMAAVLRVSVDDLDCTVQAGVTRKQLNGHLKGEGVFFPVDPGADASIGGMVATGASGTNAVRYGTMRHNVLGLTAVLADGTVVRTGGRARKSSAGYDLTRLLVGSEGTLAIITEVTLRLYGQPEAVSAAVCPFPSLGDAVRTVIVAIQLGIPVARAELMDERQVEASNRYSDLDNEVAPTLLFEFHGSPAGVEEQARAVAELAAEHGGRDFRWATSAGERMHLWQARHDAYYAALALRPGSKGWTTDVCVPISALARCIELTREDLDASSIIATVLGHVGDGNFHVVMVLDPDDPEELAEADRINQRLVARALEMGGTCTGEHGIGYGKISSLEREHGAGVDVMRAVKRALDPAGLLNPGKVFRM